jgi:hypothetical protein
VVPRCLQADTAGSILGLDGCTFGLTYLPILVVFRALLAFDEEPPIDPFPRCS